MLKEPPYGAAYVAQIGTPIANRIVCTVKTMRVICLTLLYAQPVDGTAMTCFKGSACGAMLTGENPRNLHQSTSRLLHS